MPIIVVGLSHHTAPVALRERFAFAEARVPAVLQQLRESRGADEAGIVSACNRGELYAAARRGSHLGFAALRDFLPRLPHCHDPWHQRLYAPPAPRTRP